MPLFKKAMIVSLAMILALGSIGTVAAEPGERPEKDGKGRFATGTPVPKMATPKPGAEAKELRGNASLAKRRGIKGTLSAKSSDSITVGTKSGTIEIEVNDQTKYKVPGKKDATLDDIPVDSTVAVRVSRTVSETTALAVHLIPGKPQRVHRVGEVSALTDTSITVKNKKGEESTFSLIHETKYLPAGEKPKVGDVVTVVASRIPSEPNWTAKAVVIHQKKEK